MKLKNKKRALTLLLAMALATNGCSNKKENEEFKENYLEIVDKYLDELPFYDETFASESNAKFYGDFYHNYLNAFVQYINKDQYDEFMKIVYNMSNDDRYEFIKTRENLNSIMMSSEDSFGYGFYDAFNSRLIYEELFATYKFRDDTLMHINTLKSIINNDEAFYSSLFSKDIDNVIDCICENTGFENRELVEELILKYDLLADLSNQVEKDYLYQENLTYEQRELKKQYEVRIQEIMNMLVKSKCDKDSDFANTFYGQALKKSKYYDGYNSIIVHLIRDSFDWRVNESLNTFSIELPNSYLYSNISIEEIKKDKVNSIIKEAFDNDKNSDHYYQANETMTLFSLLLTPDALDSQESFYNIDPNRIRTLMYEDLKKYFKTEDEFNTDFLYVYSGSMFSLYDYFSLFAARLKENGITYEDFLRYRALINYNSEKTYVHYNYYDDDYRYTISNEELKNMRKDEYRNFVSPYYDNTLFSDVDYHVGFEIIEDVLRENDLGYTNIYNPDLKIAWQVGYIDYLSNGSKVISSKVSPNMMEYNGTNVIYYEYPENYENGEAVEVFQNIDDEFTIRHIEGFKGNIIDPETEEEKTIYVVGMGDSLEGYEDVYFATSYGNFQAKKELTNGGLHE